MYIKKNIWFVYLTMIVVIAISCSKNEVSSTTEEQSNVGNPTESPKDSPAISLEDERNNSIEILTSPKRKWIFEKVVLTNSNGTFDISENFNVKDDVFTFSISADQVDEKSLQFSGTIKWNRQNKINYDATSIDDSQLEFLVSPISNSFNFTENSGNIFLAENLNFRFELIDSSKVKGRIKIDTDKELDIVLVSQNDSTIQDINHNLVFEDVFSFESNGVDNESPDLIGSYISNSIYIATREERLGPNITERYEKIIKYDLEKAITKNKINPLRDFVSKELVIYKNELKVIGAQRVSSYDLNLSNNPVSSSDYNVTSPYINTYFTRFGSAVQDESVYIIGGFLGSDFKYADRIFKFNMETETILDFVSLPEPSFGGRSEIVEDKIYTFGGSAEYYGSQAKNTILIYDFKTQNFSFGQMNKPVNFTFVGRFANLLYVGGRIDTYNELNELIDRDPFIGVYDTDTNEFKELSTDLASPNQETIHAMTVFDGKIYLLFGERPDVDSLENVIWTVKAAKI